ncbi:hypothetical protein DOM22_01160 [Bdellovibrio sp. ZAP7]|uniref:helix-turn-helix domain-containing protein n=1 Tax=Bdellovibrio sp. ZAP7 TaxID=2231053 RepID=UPI00115A19F8|nr:helix-turn-helix domain-containing protein [Bdellovibrio sp. ZAP7]QDK43867.1 hypothetical protein DOM22_01160 [Bdellovibrio sp. ZAP7]
MKNIKKPNASSTCKLSAAHVNGSARSLKTKEWLTTKAAAEYLSISEGAVRILVCRGILHASKLGSRNRFRKEDVEALIKS